MAFDLNRGTQMEQGATGDEIEDIGHRVHEGYHPPITPVPRKGGGGGGGAGRPGPRRTRSVTHTSPAHSLFEDYSGPQVDAAKTVIKTYMGFLGWPQSVDTNQMALDLLKNGLENKPQDAFEHLWNSRFLTDDMRKDNPWARFGQDADTYHQNLASATDLVKRMTGMEVSVGDMLAPGTSQAPGDPMSLLLQSAIKGSWSQQQVMDALQSGFTDIGGQKVDLSSVTAAEPWLLSGQTYQQQAQQFQTIYGAAPVDTAQLAGWYRFNQAASTMGPWYARQAVVSAPAKTTTATSQAEVR
jgi:hypothetical protein